MKKLKIGQRVELNGIIFTARDMAHKFLMEEEMEELKGCVLYHCGPIAKDGKIIAAAQEERFTRKKHDPSFPTNAVEFCLNYSGLSIDELDCIAFYDKLPDIEKLKIIRGPL